MADEADNLPDAPELSDEARVARRNRYKEARRAGLSIVEASLFADDVEASVGQLRKLVAGGATPEQIARILL